jgi:hypothetical protein
MDRQKPNYNLIVNLVAILSEIENNRVKKMQTNNSLPALLLGKSNAPSRLVGESSKNNE